MSDPISALSLGVSAAKSQIAKVPDLSSSFPGSSVQNTGTFADVLADLGATSTNKLNAAESISIEALRGNAGPREVAEAVMSAEQSLQVAIAVRDKIVTAYLEISRMAI